MLVQDFKGRGYFYSLPLTPFHPFITQNPRVKFSPFGFNHDKVFSLKKKNYNIFVEIILCKNHDIF